jgi:hypothetical protein
MYIIIIIIIIIIIETRSCYVAQAGFELKILLHQPPKCWGITGMHHHAWLNLIINDILKIKKTEYYFSKFGRSFFLLTN